MVLSAINPFHTLGSAVSGGRGPWRGTSFPPSLPWRWWLRVRGGGKTQCSRSQAEMKWASVGLRKKGRRACSPNSAGKLAIRLLGEPDCLFTGQQAHLEILGRKVRASPGCLEPGHLGESPHTHERGHNPQSSKVAPPLGQNILQLSPPQVEVRCRPHGVLNQAPHVGSFLSAGRG